MKWLVKLIHKTDNTDFGRGRPIVKGKHSGVFLQAKHR